ncbi:MAG: PilZ domain-containing protein [Terriglobales bacterium]
MSERDASGTRNTRDNERRRYERIKIAVPIEIQGDTIGSPIRGATSDLSLGGCYIETVYPFPVGTNLDLQLSLSVDTIVLVAATVATCDPQVGNGIRFSRMLSEDQEALKAFLEAAKQAQEKDAHGAAAG